MRCHNETLGEIAFWALSVFCIWITPYIVYTSIVGVYTNGYPIRKPYVVVYNVPYPYYGHTFEATSQWVMHICQKLVNHAFQPLKDVGLITLFNCMVAFTSIL